MQLNSMGISIRHEDTFLIDRPLGVRDNLLLVFLTEAIVWKDDKPIEVHPGSFLLYKKWTKQKYGAAEGEYGNHYIHFDGDEEMMEKLGIWTDVPGYLQNIEEIENLFRLLSREQISDTDYHSENENLLLHLILRKIAENQCEQKTDRKDVKHLEELTGLRSEMYSTPGKYCSIKELAKAVNLSLSYFQALYSDYFAISCYEDLLNARMSRGREFLINSDMSVREIANLCGYESDTCFMRCFKKREGMTPSEYRKRNCK